MHTLLCRHSELGSVACKARSCRRNASTDLSNLKDSAYWQCMVVLCPDFSRHEDWRSEPDVDMSHDRDCICHRQGGRLFSRFIADSNALARNDLENLVQAYSRLASSKIPSRLRVKRVDQQLQWPALKAFLVLLPKPLLISFHILSWVGQSKLEHVVLVVRASLYKCLEAWSVFITFSSAPLRDTVVFCVVSVVPMLKSPCLSMTA